MNMDLIAARQLAGALRNSLEAVEGVQVAICPPFVALDAAYGILHGSVIQLGAQNMHAADSGAFTGEVSAGMLRSVGCRYVILGHSERRSMFGETDADVQAKVLQALAHRLVPIVCVGEHLDDRDAGREEAVVAEQLRGALADVRLAAASDLVVAYEPVWAIGTGRTASPDQAQAMHAFIRSKLTTLFGAETAADILILYGGSMKPDNADELLAQPDIDGGLIGGASLMAESFLALVQAAGRAVEPAR
jgi:triosephosphate isomerase